MRLFDQRRLLGGTAILALTQFGASVAGLLRERFLFQAFPPQTGITDVYFAAFRPSDFLFQACIVSALGTVLVPVLAGYHARGNDKEMDRVLSATMFIGALFFGCVALLFALFLPVIAPHLVQFEGEQLALYVKFGRLALLSNFLFVFGSTFGQQLITVQRYWAYGITPILYTSGTILGTLFLTPHFGPFGPMLGTVGGALVYALVRGIDVYWSGSRLMPVLWHPDLAKMFLLMLPRVLSLGALQMQLLFFDSFASGLGTGSITINSAARNFQSVVVGVVGIALAQAIYSPLSQAAARSDVPLYIYYLRKALLYTLVLTVPGAIVLVGFAPLAARVVSLDSVMAPFQLALFIYAFSIPLESMNHLLLRGYYALKDTLFAAIFSVTGGLVAVIVSWLLLPSLNVYALAAGFVAGQLTQTIGLGSFLPLRLRQLKPVQEPIVTMEEETRND